jgi:AraC-like DNA-binding protein
MGHALRYLDDLSKLNQSPLARLTYVERLAKNEYYGCILPRGQALRQLLLVCIEQVMSDGSEEHCLLKACQYLQLRRNGYGCQQISAEMGLSREHVSRHYRKQALDLVLESFLHRIENGV